jgi:3-isopropylmalate dehydrogenase
MEANVRSYVVAHLPGDGIGPEVTAVARDLVDRAGERHGFRIDWRPCPLGSEHYLGTGQVLPDDVLNDLRKTDAIFLGAVGSPSVPPGVLERGLLLRLRFELDLYVNLRPARLRPGVPSYVAGALDAIVVRENTEGLYAGAGGIAHRGSPFEVATEESLNTRTGVERCVRYAASLATKRSGKLTLVHKTNVLVNAGSLWKRAADEIAAETGVQLDYCHVDAACLYMVSDPGRFDVIVTDNLFGDILTDLAAALTGGLGLSASGNLNPDKTGPSMFEPVHGSAPDMLDHLGEPAAAAELEASVDAVLAAGGSTSTEGWSRALTAEVSR